MVPFILMMCALTCAIAASIRNHGVDGLWAATIVFIILAFVIGHAGDRKQKARK